jgi:hypothetical protein
VQRVIIDQAGPVGAATRALLWLGADAAGLAIPPAGRREIVALLATEELAPGVLAALERLYERLGEHSADPPDGAELDQSPARRMSVAPAWPPARTPTAGDDDLFGAIGHEFGE